MKKWLSYIVLFLFSFQVLPVKELGKMLFKSQLTEERVGDIDDLSCDDDLKPAKEADRVFSYDSFAQDHAREAYFSHRVVTAIHIAEQLPKVFVPDILTPPPNKA